MICLFSNKINTQNEKLWEMSLEELYAAFTRSVRTRMGRFFIPGSSGRYCDEDNYILYGHYTRKTVIDVQRIRKEDGSSEFREIEIEGFKIQRIMDRTTGATHAVLGELFIPYKQYTIRYVLYHLKQFFSQPVSQESYCLDECQLNSIDTFRTWLNWMRDHITVLHEMGLVENYRENLEKMRQWVREIAGDIRYWQEISLQRLNLGLFQDHRMPENTVYRSFNPAN